ncbi:MAG: class II glutamine amidotransferase [Lachnospiraceae bacterium]|nr:class II glutamine amidotransferase [Lachnospiraceae bacterium]
MCELFGITANRKVNINRLLDVFFSHAEAHPNGWGLAFFDEGNVLVEKEPLQASKSYYLKCRLKENIETARFVAHIRRATIGDDSYSNSHPFVATDNSGRIWTLIHNGTIFEAPDLSVYRHYQKGSTDSERILLYLIEQVNRQLTVNHNVDNDEQRFILVENILKQLSYENKLNLIIFDGEYMYVHKNAAGTLYIKELPGVAIFSTQPLENNDSWHEVFQNKLLVYKDGSLVYSGKPHEYSYVEDPEKIKLLFLEYSQL